MMPIFVKTDDIRSGRKARLVTDGYDIAPESKG